MPFEFLASLPAPILAYVVCWCAACLGAACLAWRDRRRLLPEAEAYGRFLCVPWKLALFAPAFLFVTFAGRFAYDDTWDVVTGGGMSLLTFATAPWAAGAAYGAAAGARPRRDLLLAGVAWLFSASWFYDGYLLWRDGAYGNLWLPNLFVSPVLYVAAGLVWNLEPGAGGKASFSFLRPGWPQAGPRSGIRHVILPAAPFVIFAAALLLASVRWRLEWMPW